MPSDWPATVPILSADMLCRGEYHDGSRHCLMAWFDKTFGGCSAAVCTAADIALRNIVYDLTGGDSRLSNFNDNELFSLEQVADAWNEAMGICRYRNGVRK